MGDLIISEHSIGRFNSRYMNVSETVRWNISELRSYMKKIISPSQEKKLNKIKHNKTKDGLMVNFGHTNIFVVANNVLITILNKKKEK